MSTYRNRMVMAYPSRMLIRRFFQGPIMWWRLGLGPLIGQVLMILTTLGRKSGQPRRIAIEYHQYKGRKYIFSAFGAKSDWFKNIEADPHVTIQTAHGTEHVIARRITDDSELAEAYAFIEHSPIMRGWLWVLGMGRLTLDEFIAHKDKFYIITFDLTDAPTPPPLKADLQWVWTLIFIASSLSRLMQRQRDQRKRLELPEKSETSAGGIRIEKLS